MRTFLLRLSRLIGNSLLYGSIFALIIWGTTYAMTGTKMLPNFLSSGVDFISFFSDTGTGNAGVDAKSYYARSNGSWIWYPGDNRNYLRNHTFLSGALIDENNNNYYVNPDGTTNLNQLCLNGVCKTVWPASTSGGIVTGTLRWSSEYGAMTLADAWSTCSSLTPSGSWRIPSADEIELSRRANAALFQWDKWFWSTSPGDSGGYKETLAWNSVEDDWWGCQSIGTACNWLNHVTGSPMAFRCVSDV